VPDAEVAAVLDTSALMAILHDEDARMRQRSQLNGRRCHTRARDQSMAAGDALEGQTAPFASGTQQPPLATEAVP
jgi:hypothetical protein